MDKEIAGLPELYKINNPEAMLEIATLDAQLKLEAPATIPPEEKIPPLEAERTKKADKTTALDHLRGTKLGRVTALAGTVIALAAAGSIAKDVIAPTKAKAVEECTYEEVVSPDGNSTSTKKVCSSDGVLPDASSPKPETSKPPNPQEEAETEEVNPNREKARREARHEKMRERRERRKERRENRRERRANSQKDFKGYEMGASSFTDGNGCFITAVASALRRETGNSKITPRRIYYSALRKRWSPSGGVNGFLFDALPAMAAKHKVKVRDTSYKGMVKAIKRGDEGLVLAAPGHFTAVGHYMAARRVTRNGRVMLDDPNGKGRHGDSERRKGWSGRQLKAAGVIDYRVLHRKGVK